MRFYSLTDLNYFLEAIFEQRSYISFGVVNPPEKVKKTEYVFLVYCRILEIKKHMLFKICSEGSGHWATNYAGPHIFIITITYSVYELFHKQLLSTIGVILFIIIGFVLISSTI